ncbi:hypothetical protein [Ramlibacter sp.]|uniref:hypothetical protein n=1 Tax=Ramlibacter sp. TaxID=1917967 RepID=UPI00181D1B78|nr:hypothetical protein [Ramlibacter sp.]MBA2673138.1 hypothetical protein [Ramlibacter sp.]
MFKKCLAAAAVAILVTACGGGSDTPTAATPQAAIEALRAQSAALAPMAVTPAAAADQLMNFGETTFPGYFPTHQATQTTGPFAYRYYPQTGIYLGVVVTPSSGYQLYGVYVMGGAFGNAPQYVGPMTSFINVDIGSGGGGTGNGCYDLALAETQGTHMQVDYQYSGDITGSQTVDTLVGGLATFQGYQARETTITTSGNQTTQGIATSNNLALKSYSVRSGTAEITHYGSLLNGTASAMGITSTTNMTTVYSPPYVEQQYSLAVGQTYTHSQTAMTSGTVSVLGYSNPIPQQTSTLTVSVKYVGQEAVTVPAGTYNTCKMETSSASNGTTSVQTNWFIVGKGIPVKTTMTGGGVNQTIQATSVKLNGASL